MKGLQRVLGKRLAVEYSTGMLPAGQSPSQDFREPIVVVPGEGEAAYTDDHVLEALVGHHCESEVKSVADGGEPAALFL